VQLERLIAYKSLVWGAGQARVGGVSLKVYTLVDDGQEENGMDRTWTWVPEVRCALTLVDKAYTLCCAAIYMSWSELRVHTCHFLRNPYTERLHTSLPCSPVQPTRHCQSQCSTLTLTLTGPACVWPVRAGTAASHFDF
jgi:hypothetical protein